MKAIAKAFEASGWIAAAAIAVKLFIVLLSLKSWVVWVFMVACWLVAWALRQVFAWRLKRRRRRPLSAAAAERAWGYPGSRD